MFRFTGKMVLSLMLIMGMVGSMVGASVSAAVELSATRKAAFDKAAARADAELGKAMVTSYDAFMRLQSQEAEWEAAGKAVYYRNQETVTRLKQEIKEIDAVLIESLEAKLKRTKEGYEPLFALYRTVDKKAKSTQATKIAVELARQDIKLHESRLKTAKSERTKKVKSIQAILAEADPVRIQIKAEKSKVSKVKKEFNAEWTKLGTAIKQGEPKPISKSLTALVQKMQRLIAHKKVIYTYEQRISSIVGRAQSKLRSVS